MSNSAKILDFSAAHQRRSSRMENQKQGHFALFRSLLSKEWAKDTAKLAMWVRLIGEAAYKPRTVEFSGKQWHLQPGELVTTAAILARKLRDQDGKEKSPQAVTRMINFFAREGMITTKGTRFGTVICITNYGEYQGVLPDEPRDKPSDNNKPSAGAALGRVPDEPRDKPSDEQNKKLVEQEYKNITQTHEVGLSGEKKLTPRQAGTNPRATGTNPRAKLPDFDRQKFVDTWNRKAEQFGLPKIKGISTTTENGIKRLWKSYLKHCKDTGNQPTNPDAFFAGYITYGYKPTAWACGENPDGRRYGIDTALTQKKIDEIISQEG